MASVSSMGSEKLSAVMICFMAASVLAQLLAAMGPAVTLLTSPRRPATTTQVRNNVTVSLMMYLGSISTFSLVLTSWLISQPPPSSRI